MIHLTNRQFMTAVNTGAYSRFASIRKTITAGHKNRKVPAAVQAELKILTEAQVDLLKRFGGVVDPAIGVVYPPEKAAEADAAHAEWLAQDIELPGEPVRLADLLDGGLLESDFEILEPFLTE